MIYDCFTYFNEKEILDIRVNELKELNPIHVLVESKYTFVGNEREIHKHEYENVIQGIIQDMPNNGNPWDNEIFQRNQIKTFLEALGPSDEDIIILSDVDEIPKSSCIKRYMESDYSGVTTLIMDYYGYYLNLCACQGCWKHAKITKWKYFKNYTPQQIRHDINDNIIEDAGWHFGWVGGLDKILYKFKNFSHQEESVQRFANPELLKRKMENGISLWGEDNWIVKDISILPQYVQDNYEKFKDIIK